MIRVFINKPAFSIGSLDIAVVEVQPEAGLHMILRLGEDGSSWESFDPGDFDAQIKPTMRLPYDTGRALLDALAHHYEGAEDTRRLRADYDAALNRVDAQTAVIADVLRTLAGKVGA